MFGKLLKHEWRGSRRLVGWLCAIIALSGLLTGGSLRYIVWSVAKGNQAMISVYSAVLTTSVIAILGSCVLVLYLMVYRFYKSRFTDEGYLMLTLPVTTHQQLLASIVNSTIGVLLVGLTALASFTVAVWAFMSIFDPGTIEEMWWVVAAELETLSESMELTASGTAFLLPLIVIAFLADVILLMLAVTVGAQASKHPVWKGAAVYILTDKLVSEACVLIGNLLDDKVLVAAIACVIYGVLAVVAYLIMHHIMEKRLNLI